MTAPDASKLAEVASECIGLVRANYDQDLDWSLESLEVLDGVCAALLADGPLDGQRLELWTALVGAYVGEVLIRAHSGQWIRTETGAFAILVSGVTEFPFANAARMLCGEPFKSLASFGRALPVIVERQAGPARESQ